MLSRKRTPHERVDDSHSGQGNVKGPAHVSPGDVGTLLRALEKNSPGRVHLCQASMRFDKAHGHALGGEGFLPDVIRLFKPFFNIPEVEI
jgi:hypothetical protein